MMQCVHSSTIQNDICLAFEAVGLDGGLTLCQGRAIDDHLSPDSNGSVLNARDDWRGVSSGELCEFSDAFVFLDGKGLRFYLPAAMTLVLSDSDDACSHLREQLVYVLESTSIFRRLTPLLTLRQRRCIVSFLALHMLGSDEHVGVFIKEAVARALVQWLPTYMDREGVESCE
jgi:hypothetical protein